MLRPSFCRTYHTTLLALAPLFANLVCTTACAQDGALDSSFGSGGIVEIPWAAGYAEANAVGVDSQGRIVVGGDAIGVMGDADFALFRLLPDGTLDSTYAADANGFRLIDFNLAGIGGRSGDQINDLAVLGDGSVVTIGEAHFGLINSQFALAKVDAAGALDTTFGDGGSAHFSFDTFQNIDQGRRLRVDAAGRSVVTGTVAFTFNGNTSLDYWAGVARLTPYGQFDTPFYGNGRYYTPLWADKSTMPATRAVYNFPAALLIDSSQRVVLAGDIYEPFPQAIALMRGSPDGQYDPTFGSQSSGRVLLPLTTGTTGGVVALANGKLMVSGTYGTSLPDTPFLMRLNEDGSADTSFASNGLASAPTLGNNQFAQFGFLAQTKSGGWLLAGEQSVVNGSSEQQIGTILVRFDANGNPDASFGTNGIVTIVSDPVNRFAVRRAALQADGKLVVAGFLNNSTMDNTTHFAIVRILADYDHIFVNGFEATP